MWLRFWTIAWAHIYRVLVAWVVRNNPVWRKCWKIWRQGIRCSHAFHTAQCTLCSDSPAHCAMCIGLVPLHTIQCTGISNFFFSLCFFPCFPFDLFLLMAYVDRWISSKDMPNPLPVHVYRILHTDRETQWIHGGRDLTNKCGVLEQILDKYVACVELSKYQ